MDSAASVGIELEVREDSVDDVLVGGPEEGSDFGGVFGLFDSGMFVGVFGVGIVGVSPFVLPTKIVGVAVVVADFIIFNGVEECFHGCPGG